jgi:hypothetical protein
MARRHAGRILVEPGSNSLSNLIRITASPARPMTTRLRFRAAPRRELTAEQILTWADLFKAQNGRWPRWDDGTVGLFDLSWAQVNQALRKGYRGLPGGSSLALLLRDCRGVRHYRFPPLLTVERILEWADAHHEHHGSWPLHISGPVLTAPGETWVAIDTALREGSRGLSGRSSLAKLLHRRRGVRNHLAIPQLTIAIVLKWADAYFARNGMWPSISSGQIPYTRGDTWKAVDFALRDGHRGLPVHGLSLARLLAEHRGVRNPAEVPRLKLRVILDWADAHNARSGKWPTAASGPIPEAAGETWCAIDTALAAGSRGLRGGDSLARLLARRRGRRNKADLPPLTREAILQWADGHHRRTGVWPTSQAGSISDAPNETWMGVERSLRRGFRGLPGGESLARLLEAERGVRNPASLPPITTEQVLLWADTHHDRTGSWPTSASGPAVGSDGETWSTIDNALKSGCRGFSFGGSLAKLLAANRGVRNHLALPPLSVSRILRWADAHRRKTGEWPHAKSGPIENAPDENWNAVESALAGGNRGLPGGDTLARLLGRERGKRNRKSLAPLSLKQIEDCILAHRRQTGAWPNRSSGPVQDIPGETWMAIHMALYAGQRGLPGGSSLSRIVRLCAEEANLTTAK